MVGKPKDGAGGGGGAKEPTVRRATTADMAAVGRLGALLIRDHHAFDAQRFLAETPETAVVYASFLRTQLNKPAIAVLVAVSGDNVIGYAYAGVEGYDYMSLRGPAGVLHDIVVDPEHRGRGVGRLLLDAALAFMKSRGVPRVVLNTAQGNAAAQRLFTKAGFRKTMVEMTREL